MRILLLAIVLALQGCAGSKVRMASDDALCHKHGEYVMLGNAPGDRLTSAEIEKRGLDKAWCSDLANQHVKTRMPWYKTQNCRALALQRLKGNYERYKEKLEAIKKFGFFDKECEGIAQFYNIRLRRDRLESDKISDDFIDAPDQSETVLKPVAIQ